MTARAARIRTESMVVRLSKQPISEGYAQWDKGFLLGAMRLFIVKAESVPPFQLASCLDAIAHLMMEVNEFQDAEDNLRMAADKYDMIQNPILAKLMRAKILEAKEKPEEALAAVRAILKDHDEVPSVAATKDQKTKTGLARCYFYAAELLSTQNENEEAIEKVQLAISLGWDRVHCGHVLNGTLQQVVGNLDASLAAFQAGITANANCLAAYEGAAATLKLKEAWMESIPFLDKAIAIQPHINILIEKAMALSNAGNDQEAIAWLDQYIASPPQTELDPTSVPVSPAALFKAKAAILADGGNFGQAIATLQTGIQQYPDEADLKEMLEQVEKSSVGE